MSVPARPKHAKNVLEWGLNVPIIQKQNRKTTHVMSNENKFPLKNQEMRQMLNHNQTLETWRKFGAVLRLYSVHGGGDFLRANVVFERKTQQCLRKEGTHHSSSVAKYNRQHRTASLFFNPETLK